MAVGLFGYEDVRDHVMQDPDVGEARDNEFSTGFLAAYWGEVERLTDAVLAARDGKR